MNNNYGYIYESAQMENFEKQILSGYITKDKLEYMIENNQLTSEQLKVVEELAPVLGGLKNLGKAALGGLKGAYQQGKQLAQGAIQKGRDAYQQGVENQQQENFKKTQAKQWNVIDQTINNSQLFQKMEQFRKMFPQDKFVNDISNYVNKAFLELQEYLSKYYPYTGAQSTGLRFQSDLDAEKAQQNASAQADAGVSQMNRKNAGVTNKQMPVQNTRKSKIPNSSLRQRQRSLQSDSWKRA